MSEGLTARQSHYPGQPADACAVQLPLDGLWATIPAPIAAECPVTVLSWRLKPLPALKCCYSSCKTWNAFSSTLGSSSYHLL